MFYSSQMDEIIFFARGWESERCRPEHAG